MATVLCRVAGQWQDNWPATDRGLHYGDGLFETMRLSGGQLPLWSFHQARLQAGLVALGFPSSTMDTVLQALDELSVDLPGPDATTQSALLQRYSAAKLVVTRGVGPRGYAVPDPTDINIQLQLFDAPAWRWASLPAGCTGLTTGVNGVRLARQPLLAGLKHLNRLEQVLARAEFQPGWDESLMLDEQGNVIEGCYSNLIVYQGGRWLTPALDTAGVNGVIRQWLCQQLDITITRLSLENIQQADALFLCNSLMGVVPVAQLDHVCYRQHSIRDCTGNHEALNAMQALQTRLESLF